MEEHYRLPCFISMLPITPCDVWPCLGSNLKTQSGSLPIPDLFSEFIGWLVSSRSTAERWVKCDELGQGHAKGEHITLRAEEGKERRGKRNE